MFARCRCWRQVGRKHYVSIKTLSTRLIYENRWLRLREDSIARDDGSSGLYSVVEKPDFAVIAALEGDGMYLVEQFRYPVGARFWELPQGSLEDDPTADPLKIARAELREEPV